MTNSPPYTLDHLAETSGFEARTIRSWIHKRVLPPARGKGRGAYYDDEHLDRLLFIRRLRDDDVHFPIGLLPDVFDRLYSSDDPGVVRRVALGEEAVQVAGFLESPLPTQGIVCSEVSASSGHDSPLPKTLRDSGKKHGFSAPSPRRHQRPDGGPWTTIEIRDGLELRLRGDDPERVAWLARMARKLREWIEQGDP